MEINEELNPIDSSLLSNSSLYWSSSVHAAQMQNIKGVIRCDFNVYFTVWEDLQNTAQTYTQRKRAELLFSL